MSARQARTPKVFRRGTHRAAAPAETIKRVERLAGALGVTRLANITGLDYLGIPVFAATRPNSCSLSVSQGKGLDDEIAAASALMEAAELAHAERPRVRTLENSYASIRKQARAADPSRLPRLKGTAGERTATLDWVEGTSLGDRSPIFVPFDLVHADYRRPRRRKPPLFFADSNGLASGNHWLEAVCAGICEVIERDALALWRYWRPERRTARRLALSSVRDRDCRVLLDRLSDRGMSVAVWDITTDVGVACLLCRIDDSMQSKRAPLGSFWGAGCHLSREIALTRAVTEAAQSRLTYIAGSRDDLSHREYHKRRVPRALSLLPDYWEERQAQHTFQSIPSNAAETFEDDAARLLLHLRKAGLEEVIAVDLTDDRYGIPVVRIIVPDAEPHDEDGCSKPGRRARALARRLQ